MVFTSFVGNEDVKNSINTALISSRLPHAIILQGEDGLGKFTLAKLIAGAVVCKKDKLTAPCGLCSACIKLNVGSHPDVRIIEGSGVSKSINTEAVRKMTEDAYRMPEEADYNVYILKAGERLSKSVQNKLLKIIEEPPKGTMFIITIKSAESLLSTIRSRATIFTLKPVSQGVAEEFLQEKTGKDIDDCQKAISLFGGNIGKAINFLKGESSDGAFQIASKIAELINTSDENEVLAQLCKVQKDREMFQSVCENLSLIFRDACVLRVGYNETLGINRDVSDALSYGITRNRLILLPDICRKYRGYCARNANMSLLMTCFCSELRSAVGK